jgi:anaerobic selenocysteine-containing dehydrogenase
MAEFICANVNREMEVYGYDKVVKSHCRMCHGGCGVLVYTKNGRVEKIGGDPDCPINHGTLCSKGIAAPQLAYHPDRLTYPIRRIGPKASGEWERISWGEALDTIAERILHYKEKNGAESIVLGYGTGRENEAVIYRFANLLGTPNVLTAGHFCYGPRIATSIITCGSNPIVDYENNPKCIMVWGNNLVISNPDCYKGEPFSRSVNQGAKIIAVDPRLTRIAARADVWLQLRPGTDTALALGMLNVICMTMSLSPTMSTAGIRLSNESNNIHSTRWKKSPGCPGRRSERPPGSLPSPSRPPSSGVWPSSNRSIAPTTIVP